MHPWHRRARQSAMTILVIACWAQAVVPRMLQSLTAPKVRAAAGEATAGYTHPAQLSKDALTLAVLGVCAVVVIGGLRSRRSGAVGVLAVALAPWLYLMVRGAYSHAGLLLAVLLYPAVVLAVWTLRPRIRELGTLGILVGLTAISCMLMAVVWPDAALFRSSFGDFIAEDKQILPWGMLEGYLTQPNNLGQTLAVGLPLIFLVRPRMLRAVLVGCTGIALVWTASRSSLYSVAIAAAVAAVVALARRSRPPAALLSLAAVAVTVVVLPLTTSDPSAFTNRGYIWGVSIDAWQSSPWVGNGANWYGVIASTAANLGSTVFHGHNQAVQIAVTGGVLLLLLVVWQYVLAARRAARMPGGAGLFATTYLAALLGTCILEVSLAYVDNFSLLFVVALPTAVILFQEAPVEHRVGRPAAPAHSQQDAGKPENRRPAAELMPVAATDG
jgi:O-antigen ligase